MDRTNGREVKLRREWRGIVEAQARSGKTAAVFCRGHEIPYTNFLYHRRKLQKSNQPEVSKAQGPGLMPLDRPGSFMPVKIEGFGSIRLRFPGGLVVESDGLPPAGWVVELARHWSGEGESSC